MQYHFDVNSIIKIEFRKETPNSRFEWREEKKVKRFFGLLSPKIYPAGFYDNGSYHNYPYTKEQLVGYDYNVYEWDQRVKDRVCYKPYVAVRLTHGQDCGRYFNTDEEAYVWINRLKNLSGKTFEIIEQ